MAVDYGQLDDEALLANLAADPSSFLGNEQQLKQAAGLYGNTDMVKLIETYTEDDLPKPVKESPIFNKFWAFFSRSPKWTFLSREDRVDYDYFLHNAKLNFLLMTPSYEYGFKEDMILDNLDFHNFINMTRAMGTPHHIINERTMEATTISQNISNSNAVMSQGGMKKPGIFGRIAGMF